MDKEYVSRKSSVFHGHSGCLGSPSRATSFSVYMYAYVYMYGRDTFNGATRRNDTETQTRNARNTRFEGRCLVPYCTTTIFADNRLKSRISFREAKHQRLNRNPAYKLSALAAAVFLFGLLDTYPRYQCTILSVELENCHVVSGPFL